MKGKGKTCVFIPPLPSLLRKRRCTAGCETLLHQKRILSVAFVEYGDRLASFDHGRLGNEMSRKCAFYTAS